MMKLLANENFPKGSVIALRKYGYDVFYIGEALAGIKDTEVIDFAIEEIRIILTFDRDYGELIFKKGLKPPMGVIYLRIDSFAPDEPAAVVDRIIKSRKFNFGRCLTVVDNNFVRQRKY